jgi:hypothetical protein
MPYPTATLSDKLLDASGNVPANAKVYYRLVTPPGPGAFDGRTLSVIPDPGTGAFSFTIFENAEYEIWVNRGQPVSFTTNTDPTQALPEPLLGDRTP